MHKTSLHNPVLNRDVLGQIVFALAQ